VRHDATPETEPPSKLTPAQITALAALAGGGNVSVAADAAGVHRASIYRWLDDDAEFLAELNRLKAEQRAALAAQVGELTAQALEVVRGVLTDPAVPAAVRLKAAMAVLERAGALEPAPAPGPVHPGDIKADRMNRSLIRRLAG
jgi:AcrR family transcriptional regulator